MAENLFGRAALHNIPIVKEEHPVGYLARKTHLVVTTSMVIPESARFFITSSTSLIISGSNADVGSSEEHNLGLHGQGARDGHALLLAPRQLSRVLVGLFRMPTRANSSRAICSAFLLGPICAPR